MKAFNYSLLLLLPLFIPFTGSSQDQIFMNTSQSLLSLNPSFAGSNGRFRSQFTYANDPMQWSGNVTYQNSFDFYLNAINAGVAVSASSDMTQAGRLQNSGLSLSYAQYFTADNGKLKIVPSVRAAYQRKQLDINKLTFGDIVDTRLSFFYPSNNYLFLAVPANRLQYFSIDAGLLVQYRERLYAGVSVSHMNRPYTSMISGDSRLPALVTAHASYNTSVSDNTLLNLSVRHTQQRNYYNTQLNALLVYKHLVTGLGFAKDSGRNIPMTSLGLKTKAITLSLSYGYLLPVYKPGLGSYLGYGNRHAIWELNFSFRLGKRGAGAPMALEAN